MAMTASALGSTSIGSTSLGSASGRRRSRTCWPVLFVLLLGSGCVSQAAYEEAKSAAQVEREAHLRAETQLREVRHALEQLKSDLDRRESALQEHERRLAEADLNLKLAHQERDENGQLVDQLRGELARVGDHLRVYSDEKTRLAEELRVAENRSKELDQTAARIDELTAVVRDLSLLEGESINAGTIALRSNGRYPVLEVPRHTLAAENQLNVDGQRIVKSLGRLSALHTNLTLVVSERDGAHALPDPRLLRNISGALAAAGVASEKVVVDMAAGGQGGDTADALVAAPAPAGEPRILFVLQLGDTASAPLAVPPSKEAAAEPSDSPPE